MLFAQKNINSYKYILVPKQFEFQKSADQYQLNSLTKFLFERAGFKVFFSDDSFPADLANNRCSALTASINNPSSFLSTKLTVNLSDCYNNTIFTTKEGLSREKNYKSAYQEALRDAFVDIENLKYAYDGTLTIDKKISEQNTIQSEKLSIKEILPVDNVKKVTEVKDLSPIEVAKQIVEKETNETKNEQVNTSVIPKFNSIEGKYLVDKWGLCNISVKEGYYSFVGGDEKFEFAVIYKTSVPNLFIIKWVAFKQPRLLELDLQGNLKVEDENGEKNYNRVQ
jgi:hypothetical protein